MSTRSRLIVSGVCALLALAGCDNNKGVEPTNVGRASSPVVATTEALPQPGSGPRTLPVLELNHVSTLQMSSQEFQAELTVRQGDLRRPDVALINGNALLYRDCKFDRERDAVVPFAFTLTNKTDGPPLHFMLMWGISRQQADSNGAFAKRVEIAETYMDARKGVQTCKTWDQRTEGSSWIRTSDAIPLDKEFMLNTQGFIILRNYYSSQFPEGDTEAVRHAVLAINSVGVGREPIVGGSLLLQMSNPGGGMRKLNSGNDSPYGGYGVSLVPNEVDKNCLTNNIPCP